MIHGIGIALVVIPMMPELEEAILQDKKFNYKKEDLSQNISGLFIASLGIGETIGPILGSTLVETIDFASAQ